MACNVETRLCIHSAFGHPLLERASLLTPAERNLLAYRDAWRAANPASAETASDAEMEA